MITQSARATYILLIMAYLVTTPPAQAATKEQKLKAAFLVQFVKYTTWPNDNLDTITIGIFGKNTFTDAFERYEGKRLHGREIVVKTIERVEEIRGCCQLLFISKYKEVEVETVLNRLQHDPVLTVSEATAFSTRGGIIHLIRKGTKQKFIINITNAKKASISLDTRMQNIAYAIEK